MSVSGGKITQAEAEKLIKMLKRTLSDTVYFPTRGKTKEFEVQGENKGHLFSISIYRGKINGEKYNINARIKLNNIMLLELHVGDTLIHKNPDGEKIVGSHWHVYHENYGRSYAVKAENIKCADFVQNTVDFLIRFNVVERPKVLFQPELI